MRVVAAMSGGVDSSVAAVSLLRAGHEVLGVHLRMRDAQSGQASNCISPAHEADARAVAQSAGMAFRTLDMREIFEIEIARPFLQAYAAGETPSPCVACNVRVKLGPLARWAAENGFDKIATGHYARVALDAPTGRWQLRRGCDPLKDQSYYLCALDQATVARLMLPLGEMAKTGTRRLAQEWGLPVAEKADSQDICLVGGQGDYRQYLAARLGEAALGEDGPIVTTAGEEIGRHRGLAQYTVGQRRGLGISHPRPLYVVALRPENNTLVVGEEEDLLGKRLRAADFRWIAGQPPKEEFRASVQIRYQHKAAPAIVRVPDSTSAAIEFDEPQRAIAPGQIAAVYDGEVVLGGGKIQRAQ